MLFTSTVPALQGDRIMLYLDSREARRASGDGRTVFGVAVDLDASGRRLTSLPAHATAEDPLWGTPAYFEDFRRIVARGPIPSQLFTLLPLGYIHEENRSCKNRSAQTTRIA